MRPARSANRKRAPRLLIFADSPVATRGRGEERAGRFRQANIHAYGTRKRSLRGFANPLAMDRLLLKSSSSFAPNVILTARGMANTNRTSQNGPEATRQCRGVDLNRDFHCSNRPDSRYQSPAPVEPRRRRRLHDQRRARYTLTYRPGATPASLNHSSPSSAAAA